MDEDGLEAMEEFISGPLVTWMQTLEDLVGRSPNQLPRGEEEANEYFRKLAVQEMKKLVQLLLGCAVQCEQRDVFIGRIQLLEISVQAALASAIKEVSQEPENVLGLQWSEMDSSSMQQLLWDLGSRVQKLVAERDAGLEVRDTLAPPPPFSSHKRELQITRDQIRSSPSFGTANASLAR
ncbi:hypothetical protein E2320_013890 [Naja naja]|nr:hypothetical protein E2320_013890 [Naja naja]